MGILNLLTFELWTESGQYSGTNKADPLLLSAAAAAAVLAVTPDPSQLSGHAYDIYIGGVNSNWPPELVVPPSNLAIETSSSPSGSQHFFTIKEATFTDFYER